MLSNLDKLKDEFKFQRDDYLIKDNLNSFLAQEMDISSLIQKNLINQNHHSLIFTSDTFTSDCHFSLSDPIEVIGHYLLRTSLLNSAAIGGQAKGYFLIIALPQDLDSTWADTFKKALKNEQEQFGLSFLGGDTITTAGPLSITLTMVGIRLLKLKQRAQPGDHIYVTGTLGDRELKRILKQNSDVKDFVKLSQKTAQFLNKRYLDCSILLKFIPQIWCFINVSLSIGEGLLTDLAHLCHKAQLPAYINPKAIPRSDAFLEVTSMMGLDPLTCALTCAQEQELLFTAPASVREQLSYMSQTYGLPLACIGYMGAQNSIASGMDEHIENYVHFLPS